MWLSAKDEMWKEGWGRTCSFEVLSYYKHMSVQIFKNIWKKVIWKISMKAQRSKRWNIKNRRRKAAAMQWICFWCPMMLFAVLHINRSLSPSYHHVRYASWMLPICSGWIWFVCPVTSWFHWGERSLREIGGNGIKEGKQNKLLNIRKLMPCRLHLSESLMQPLTINFICLKTSCPVGYQRLVCLSKLPSQIFWGLRKHWNASRQRLLSSLLSHSTPFLVWASKTPLWMIMNQRRMWLWKESNQSKQGPLVNWWWGEGTISGRQGIWIFIIEKCYAKYSDSVLCTLEPLE